MNRDELFIRWFDRWLKGVQNGIEKEPKVDMFVMGTNIWRKSDKLFGKEIKFDSISSKINDNNSPEKKSIKNTLNFVENYYLFSKKAANSIKGDGFLLDKADFNKNSALKDSFLHNPKNPVTTVGGYLCCYPPLLRSGVFDRNFIEKRDDVLVYTSFSIRSDKEVTGYPNAVLWVFLAKENFSERTNKSSVSADFNITLVDVFPDGRTLNVCDGIKRIMIDNSAGQNQIKSTIDEQPLRIEIKLWPTRYVFKRNHRIRIEITGSNFPKFEINPGTELKYLPAGQKGIQIIQHVFHSENYPSRIELPVLPN